MTLDVILTVALGVGGATVFGSVLGFVFHGILVGRAGLIEKVGDVMQAFAAGVMLSASIIGLILPSLEYGEGPGVLLAAVIAIFLGAACVNMLDLFCPGVRSEDGRGRAILFVLAIGLHNIPEGIAAGVGFASENLGEAAVVAIAIALQNIPEGLVIISPMLSAGISRRRAFLYAFLTGAVEVAGTYIGYFAASFASLLLSPMLAFAGGTMIYVVAREMIPETCKGKSVVPAYFLIFGFVLMIAINFLLS